MKAAGGGHECYLKLIVSSVLSSISFKKNFAELVSFGISNIIRITIN